MRFGGRVVAVVGLAAAVVGMAWGRPGAWAQGGDAGGKTTTMQVYSRLTVLDVTATDAQGQPVHGLQQSDFTVLEDGKPQPMRNFEEISTQFAQPPRQLPAGVYTNLQPPAPSPAVNILLLDFSDMAPRDSTDLKELSRATRLQHDVKQAALMAVDGMTPGTRVAVLLMNNSLRILQGFTSDPAILKAAINAAPYFLEGHAIQGGSVAGGARGQGNTGIGPSADEAGTVQSDMRNRMVLEAFEQIAADVAPMKGRKNLIWFSMGIWSIVDPNHTGALPDYSKPLSLAYDVLTAAQVSVYPVYAGGIGLGQQQLSLDMVAEATGGVAYTNSNDMATAVDKALDNGANYYSIAYVPPSEKYDGSYHKIDVKVNRPGVTLVFRKGYYADDLAKFKAKPGLTLGGSPPEARGGNMKAPMSRGLPTSADLLFDVGVQPSDAPPKPGEPPVLGTLDAKLKGKKLTRYGFQYVVPGEQIKFTDGPKVSGSPTHNGKVEFDIAVYDTNDKLLTGLSQTVTMPLSEASYRQMMTNHTPVRFYQQIDLPPGQLFVRVGVLDATTDKVGTLELPIAVGQAAQKQAAAMPKPLE